MSSRAKSHFNPSHLTKPKTTFSRHAYRCHALLLIQAVLALSCAAETNAENLCEYVECEAGFTCIEYTGIGGNRLASCEIPCGNGLPDCPANMSCSSFADGPSNVCN